MADVFGQLINEPNLASTTLSTPNDVGDLMLPTKPEGSRKKRRRLLTPDDKEVDSAALGKVRTVNCRDGLLGLPVELYLEIASYLPVKDLLRLARVCCILRDIMHSESCRPIWVKYITEAGAPACPEDMTEARYASLLFDKYCEFCGVTEIPGSKAVSIATHYELRVHLCANCLSFDGRVAGGLEITLNVDEDLETLDDIYTLVPHSEAPPSTLYSARKFFRKDLTDAVKQYQDANLAGSDKLSAYVKEMRRRKEAIVEHCVLIRDWQRRKYAEEAARQSRINSRPLRYMWSLRRRVMQVAQVV